jgi:hypothetical protein
MESIMSHLEKTLALVEQLSESELNQLYELIGQRIKIQPTRPELIRELGLIGCFSAESDLSENYKAILSESWDSKYDNS